jgi:hypothetical protein
MDQVWKICTEYSVHATLVAMGGFVVVLYRRYRALNEGIGALLRNSIITQCERFLEKGELPTHNRDNIEKMYIAYHNLGQNGSVTSLVEQARELPPHKNYVPDSTKKIE